MKNERAVYRRVLRRETHSSRTGAAVVVASILVALLVVAIGAGVWWLAAPGSRGVIAGWFASASSVADDRAALTTAGTAALVIAVALLGLALLPGRLPRRALSTDRLALLVDDGVLADAVADAVALRCGVDRHQVSARVGRRSTTVRVTPTSGIAVDRAAVAESAVAALAALGFSTAPKVVVADRGVIS